MPVDVAVFLTSSGTSGVEGFVVLPAERTDLLRRDTRTIAGS
jgi:hypothetical protein